MTKGFFAFLCKIHVLNVSITTFFLFPANIGGQMGLFCGASFITMTEIIELSLRMTWTKEKSGLEIR